MSEDILTGKKIQKQFSTKNPDFQALYSVLKQDYDAEISESFHNFQKKVILVLPENMMCSNMPEEAAQVMMLSKIVKWLIEDKKYEKVTVLHPAYVCDFCKIRVSAKNAAKYNNIHAKEHNDDNEFNISSNKDKKIIPKLKCPKCKKNILKDNPDRKNRIEIEFEWEAQREELQKHKDYIKQFSD